MNKSRQDAKTCQLYIITNLPSHSQSCIMCAYP